MDSLPYIVFRMSYYTHYVIEYNLQWTWKRFSIEIRNAILSCIRKPDTSYPLKGLFLFYIRNVQSCIIIDNGYL